jgi:Deacetylase PdaC
MKAIAKTLILPLLFAALPAAAAPKEVKFETKGEGYSFGYRYPAVIAKFPPLKAQLEKQRADMLAEIKSYAKAWLEDRPKDFGEITLDRQISWAQVANLPGYLSLTVDDYRFDGGAHGNYGMSSTVWDKTAAKRIEPIDMFASKAAFDQLVQIPYCDLLDVERSARRDGEKVDRSQADDWMQACPKPSELVVILGSSDGKKFNRMTVYAAPYAVGPYVEGDYEINMPITSALLEIVKPAYRASFAATRARR